MNNALSTRQAEELHKSIIAYLSANNLPNTAAALRIELNLGEDAFDATTTKKYENLLERKWTSVVRLQKRILDLETQNKSVQSALHNLAPSTLSSRNADPTSWLPSAPPRHTLESHRATVNCVSFHPIYTSIATGSDDYTIKIWDWETGELEKTIKGHTRAVLDVDYGGPSGGVLLASCSSDLTIKLWNPADDYKNIRTLPGHDHSVSAVRFVPSSGTVNLLVTASRDTTLKLWDVGTGYCVRTLQGHSGWVRSVSPSLDGRFLLSTGDDMTARLWDISSSSTTATSAAAETLLKATMVGHTHFNECTAIAPPTSYPHLSSLAGLKKPPPASSTAEFLATGSRDKSIRLWDSRGTCLATLVSHDNWVRAVAFHPGGRYLLSASDDKTLRCWDLAQGGRCVKTIAGAHEGFISSLAWAPGISRTAAVLSTDAASDGGHPTGSEGSRTPVAAKQQIRCVVATGGVDAKLRIFAS